MRRHMMEPGNLFEQLKKAAWDRESLRFARKMREELQEDAKYPDGFNKSQENARRRKQNNA